MSETLSSLGGQFDPIQIDQGKTLPTMIKKALQYQKLIQILLNISVLLLDECSRNLVYVLRLVEVTLMPIHSMLHNNVLFIKLKDLPTYGGH